MKVYFLNPPFRKYFSRSERSPQVAHGGTLYFPVWLSLAAAMVENHGHEIMLMDAVADGKSLKDCCSWVENGQPNMLVVEVTTASWIMDKVLIDAIKAGFPQLIITVVGPFGSALPEVVLNECGGVDFVVRGEYEAPLCDLASTCSSIEDGFGVAGVSFRRDGGITNNPRGPVIENVDDIPFASPIYKRFLDYKKYYFAAAKWPGIMLMIGRGCPHKCMWCIFNQTLHGRQYRFRSAEKIVQEFEYVIENFKDIKEIWIEDETFTANRPHVREVCRLILQKRLKFKKHPFQWYCNARPPLDFETMQLMKEAGCRLFVTGFESGDQGILDRMHKGFRIEQAEEFMKNAKCARILVHGCFMVGNPGENQNTMSTTLEYAKRLRPDSAQFYFIHPYPGTEYYKWASENGYLVTEDYSQWLNENGSHRCILNLPDVSAEELQKFCERAYREYHFNPAYLTMKVKQLITRPSEGIRSLKSGYNYLKYLVGSA